MCRRREWKTIIRFGTGMIEGKLLYDTCSRFQSEHHIHVRALCLMQQNMIVINAAVADIIIFSAGAYPQVRLS